MKKLISCSLLIVCAASLLCAQTARDEKSNKLLTDWRKPVRRFRLRSPLTAMCMRRPF